MRGRKFLEEVKLTSLLSYGRHGIALPLEPLNVLIGPNASGKSNLIEALTVLAAAPRDLLEPFRKGGGVEEWIWKGHDVSRVARIEVLLRPMPLALRYQLAFSAANYRLSIVEEAIEPAPGSPAGLPSFYAFREGRPVIAVGDSLWERDVRALNADEFSREQSILSQRKDPTLYPELTWIGQEFLRMRSYRDWDVSRGSVLRRPQQADLPNDFLAENGENLALVISDLLKRPDVKAALLDNLKLFWEAVQDIVTPPEGGTVQIFFHERGFDTPVSMARLSDGTLRFLCLLAILCHPKPPPLVCIEEPELGLHPDAIATIAKLLVEASSRTQLVVTTHSDALVSALSETPEAVVVCERTAAGTSLRRLEPARLEEWLETYRLGELWRMGEIGGNRW